MNPTQASSNAPSISNVTVDTAVLTQTSDIQMKMMLMLTDSFSKLSSALVDKNVYSKSDWPKFSGNLKKFKPGIYQSLLNYPLHLGVNFMMLSKMMLLVLLPMLL